MTCGYCQTKYVKHANKNTYTEQGSSINLDGPFNVTSPEQCMALCTDHPNCECAVYHKPTIENTLTHCYRRQNCTSADFADHGEFDVFMADGTKPPTHSPTSAPSAAPTSTPSGPPTSAPSSPPTSAPTNETEDVTKQEDSDDAPIFAISHLV